jgi:hypothetical protein
MRRLSAVSVAEDSVSSAAADTIYLSAVIGKYRCSLCGQPGHYQPTCPKREIDPAASKERERLRKAYQDNKSSVLSASKQWKQLHPERVKESQQRFWSKHRKRVIQERKQAREESYRLQPKETWLLETYRSARSRAKRWGLPFDNQVPKLELPDVCPVLGIAIIYHAQLGRMSANSPSLDRIDPALGYVASNLRVISNRANTLKNNASLDEMRLVLADMERCARCAG